MHLFYIDYYYIKMHVLANIIDILLYRMNGIVSFFEVSANIVPLGMRIDNESNRDKPSDLHP